jgi:hypothetical protein
LFAGDLGICPGVVRVAAHRQVGHLSQNPKIRLPFALCLMNALAGELKGGPG